MVRPLSSTVVASTILSLLSVHHAVAGVVDVASSVRLAQETYERLVASPSAEIEAVAVTKEDDEAGKHNSGEEIAPDSAASSPTISDDEQLEREDKNLSYDGSDLIEWINDSGGFVHPNARIGLDPTGQVSC